jgi:hypothetical protein
MSIRFFVSIHDYHRPALLVGVEVSQKMLIGILENYGFVRLPDDSMDDVTINCALAGLEECNNLALAFLEFGK